MTKNLKKFILAVNEDETLLSKIETWKDLDKDEIQEKTILLAKEAGFELTNEDFVGDTTELSDDELAIVTGGFRTCVCVSSGGGSADEEGKTCACVTYGYGADQNSKIRCECIFAGQGKSTRTPHTPLI